MLIATRILNNLVSTCCLSPTYIVLQEIEDRQEFLEEMEALGQDRQYHSKIQTEISQRIRELELIDIDRMKREFTAAAASTDYT